MNTTFDQETILYHALAASPVKAAISGVIAIGKRPDNSSKEDVVIGSIATTPGSLQLGDSVVNIHVPDISLDPNGTSQLQPDLARLKALTEMAIAALEYAFGATYNFWITNQRMIADDTGDNHFSALRIRFQFHNSPV